MTSCSGFGNESGRKSTVSTTLKMALFTPIPSARVRTATMVKPGDFRSMRKAYLKSVIMSFVR